MKPIVIVYSLFVSSLAVLAENDVETKYREASVNTLADKPINLKEWKTYREGRLIVEKTARDIANQGTWPQTTYRVLVQEKPVLTVRHFEGRVSLTYHPGAGVEVLRSDDDKDGFMERFLLLNEEGETIDILTVTKGWEVNAVSAEVLTDWQQKMKQLDEMAEKMKLVNPD